MSASQFDEFDRRMERISRRHTKLSRGYVTRVNGDGLIVAKPKRRGGKVLVRAFVLLVLVLFLFKAFLLAEIGDDAYDARVTALASGSWGEQAGSVAMAKDPITIWLANKFSSLVR